MIKVKVRGDISKSINGRIDRAIKQMTDDFYDYVKEETPVDTGYAKSRWKKRRDSVLNDADYIEYLEQGRSNQAPMGMIEPALAKLKRKWRNKKI